MSVNPSRNLVVRRLLLFGVPLALVGLELFHPVGPKPSDYRAFAPQINWWLTLHTLQIPLFGLMGLAVYWLSEDLTGRTAQLGRYSISIFTIFYAAYDTLAGVSLGLAMDAARYFSVSQQTVIYEFLEARYTEAYVLILLTIFVVGTLGWTVGVFATAIALYRAQTPRGPVLLLMLSALFLLGDHTYPYGPLTFGTFFLAVAWLEFAHSRQPYLPRLVGQSSAD